MVFVATPSRREVARMLMPSTRHPMIFARFSVLNLFILIFYTFRYAKQQGL